MQTQTISKPKISSTNKDVAVFFGHYEPFHLAHKAMVLKASMQHDAVVLVASGYEGDERPSASGTGIPLQTRFRYLRETFAAMPNVKVMALDETNIPRYPDGWRAWTAMLSQVTNDAIEDDISNHTITVYVGEQDYADMLPKYLPDWRVSLQNRSHINISATMIRENPLKYWNYIDPVFRRHYGKKVLVTGGASGGKSTMVANIARTMNAPFSEEYARTYEEAFNVNDDELTVEDYIQFIDGQYKANRKEILAPTNKGVAIFDTDVITTLTYAQLYLSEAENRRLKPFFDEYIARQEFDLVLVVPPVTKWVDDGFRSLGENNRDEFFETLMSNLRKYVEVDKIIVLDQTDEFGGYYARYMQAINAIESRLGIEIQHLI